MKAILLFCSVFISATLADPVNPAGFAGVPNVGLPSPSDDNTQVGYNLNINWGAAGDLIGKFQGLIQSLASAIGVNGSGGSHSTGNGKFEGQLSVGASKNGWQPQVQPSSSYQPHVSEDSSPADTAIKTGTELVQQGVEAAKGLAQQGVEATKGLAQQVSGVAETGYGQMSKVFGG